jgi:hypothetical protein
MRLDKIQLNSIRGGAFASYFGAAGIIKHNPTMITRHTTFPIVGGSKIEQIHDNIQALKTRLTADQISYLESVKPFDIGFPCTFNGPDPNITGSAVGLLRATASLSFVRSEKAIGYEDI